MYKWRQFDGRKLGHWTEFDNVSMVLRAFTVYECILNIKHTQVITIGNYKSIMKI